MYYPLVVIGGLFLARAAGALTASRRSANWPTTKGRIATARIAHGAFGEDAAAFLFDYVVGGKRFTSDSVWLGERITDLIPGDLDHIMSTYRVGMDVTVHFDPDAPDRCYLERRRNRTITIFVVLGLLLLVVGYFLPLYESPRRD